MMERPLLRPDELKSLPKGDFIVMKTGSHPMRTKLRLFKEWGISFGDPYKVPEQAARKVAYADKGELEHSIIRQHYTRLELGNGAADTAATGAGGKKPQAQTKEQTQIRQGPEPPTQLKKAKRPRPGQQTHKAGE